ncbi:MAG: 4Fe-4S binding protein [Firmicutes bacterium]|nr:4Fe-4S binding protein [Bacillota bacterium]
MSMKIYAMYFSATKTTEKTVLSIASGISKFFKTDYETINFTLPPAREKKYSFQKEDIVIFGTPVYAGRVPNVLLKFINSIEGNNAFAVLVVSYGNRNYDDALTELKNLLLETNFIPVSAAAFIGEHSFSHELAKGRPDECDIKKAFDFGKISAEKIKNGITHPLFVKGENPPRPHYVPKDRNGNPVDIRKVTSKVNEKCTNCGICAKVCPMGSINPLNVKEYTGICIKCGACTKKCPENARYYDDEKYLYHKRELELGFSKRREVEIFV